ncbi:MAG: EF-hand domain-containing protein [Acidobacteriota bacterium]
MRSKALSSRRIALLACLGLPAALLSLPSTATETAETKRKVADDAPLRGSLLERLDDEGKRFADVDTFALTYLDTLDDDCDGNVPLKSFIEVAGVDGGNPGQMRWVLPFDGSSDGQIQQNEVVPGIVWSLDDGADRMMALDIDGDGLLTTCEIELGIPNPPSDPEEAANYSAAIKTYYSRIDTDGDGKLSRDEFWQNTMHSHLGQYWSYNAVDRLKQLDVDGNGTLDLKELEAAFVARGITVPDRLASWFEVFYEALPNDLAPPQERPEGALDSIPLDRLASRLRFAGAETNEWRLRVETPVRPLLIPLCALASPHSSQ